MTHDPQTGGPARDVFAAGLLVPRFEGIPEAAQPFVKLAAHLQSEFLTLWSHRANAWLEWPQQACKCRTMADLTQAQGEFLTTMRRHYSDYFDAVLKDAMIEPEALEEEEPQPEKAPEPSVHREAA